MLDRGAGGEVVKYLLENQETERLYFRKIQDSDFDVWLEFFHDPKTHIHWAPMQNPPEVECRKWYEKQNWRYQNSKGVMNALIEKQSGKLIGHCGLLVQTVDDTTELEIGYSLLPKFWQRGFAFEAARKCRDFAFTNELAESLISIISRTNIPSQKVAINNGMHRSKDTSYHENEVFIYRIFRCEWLASR
jgi:[ribosomal protein S5]-alanine N-acetyltransferase